MKEKRILSKIPYLLPLLIIPLMVFARPRDVAKANDNLILEKTLTFTNGGSASATAKNEVYFDGDVVADAKVAKAAAYQINGQDALAFYITEATAGTRNITIQTMGYDLLRFTYKVNAGSMKIDFGCQPTHGSGNSITQVDVLTHGYHEVIMTLWTTSKTAQASINFIEFYNYER